MILKILKDKQLPPGVVSQPVIVIDAEMRAFAACLMGTMQYYKGVGLAAPQVGENFRLIVFDCVNITMNSMDSAFMFNPEIIESSEDSSIAEEGCLSYPKTFVKVKRNLKVTVKFIDIAGRPVIRSYSGLAARIVQHEIDHLEGITMIDREED